jgi:glycosyltransferase involved in cell wall biosynthesis
MSKQKVIILGKIPPPYFGPAIATEIILKSRLKDEFGLVHIDTRLNSSMRTIGKFSWRKIVLTAGIYSDFWRALSDRDVKLVLVPIAQETSALIKDAIFILLARLKSKKILIHLRGSALLTWYESRFIFFRILFKWFVSSSSGAIVLGKSLRYIFKPFLPPERIFEIPNGADYSFPAKTVNTRIISILYFANLQSNKGIEDTLAALGYLSAEVRNRIILNVVGSWRDYDFKKKCLNIVLEKELPVCFHNSMAGAPKWQIFADSDLFVFPPRAPEGHPWVIVEAMAAGLPVISTDQGAITESVLNMLNGLIVEPNNPEQIAEKIEYLVSHPDIMQKMGKESRRLYEENFTEAIMVKRLSNVFNTVIGLP